MGTGEESKPPKPSKPASSAQEIPTPPYPDQSSSMQAYYGPGAMPPPFFVSTVASPTPHPYLWGSQHPLISPYGMPILYPGLYPPWGVYAHPIITTTPNPIQINARLEEKGPCVKDRVFAKKFKSTSGSLGKAEESAKAASSSGNDGASQSAESGIEGASDARDENNDQKDFAASKKGFFHEMLADGVNAQSNTVGAIAEASVLEKPVSMPETNLNIGMDLWNASASGVGAVKVRQNPFGASSTHLIGSKDVMPDQRMQIPNDDALVLKVVPQIDENETQCNLQLDDKEDNDMQYNQNVKEPTYGMRFSSEQELFLYYKQYAQQVGFGVIYKGIKTKLGGSVKYLTLACACYGKTKTNTSNIGKPNPTKETGCKAKINARLVDGVWFLTTVEVDHNHALSPSKARSFQCNRKLAPVEKRKYELNDIAEVGMKKNFNSLDVEVEGYENLPFIEKDGLNFISKARNLRLGKGGAGVLRDYFTRMREMNDGFYAMMDLDDESRLRNVFWADARSRAAYEYFGDVITIDTTYLTNIYGMPFAFFVGVNHHGQSILLGAGLLSGDDTDTFVWLFETWLKCMNGQAPKAIITNQDMAIKSAIARVFPGARHRFCLSHIMRKLLEKLGSHAQYTCGLKSAIQTCVYDSQTCVEFDENWQSLLESYNLRDNAWLCELYSERTHWVPTYVKDTFWAGMSITQKSESMNAFFDSYVHSRSTLKEFVDQFDNALRKKVLNERAADFKSFNCTIPCVSYHPMEKKFQDVYTNAKFKEVRKEFMWFMYRNCSLLKSEGAISTYQVSDEVKIDDCIKEIRFSVYFNEDKCEVKCTCGLFEFRGILCRHALTVLDIRNVRSLPRKYILDQWRKDLNRTKYDDLSDYPDVQRYDSLMKSFHELALIASRREDLYLEVMHHINMLKLKLCGLRCEPSPPSHHLPNASSICNEAIDGVAVKNNKVLSPLMVRNKRKPPSKREVPTIENVVKILQAKKKQPSDNNTKQKRRKNQTCEATQEDEVNTSEAPLSSGS